MKRGEANSNAELWLLIAAILLSGFLGQSMLKDVIDRVEGKELEKNFIARDIAITIETLYAAQGDIIYTYGLGQYKYLIGVSENSVSVMGKDDNIPTTYRIVGVKNQDSKNNHISSYTTIRFAKDCPYDTSLILKKVSLEDGSSTVTVDGKNVLVCQEGNEDCEKRSVDCEQ